MNYKNIAKQFVPPILLNIYRHFKESKVIITESPLPQIERYSDSIIILGNGPSLNDSLRKYKEEIMAKDKMVVNYFAMTDLYEELRPNFYVLADPNFFLLPEHVKETVDNFVVAIIEKTTWPISLIIPNRYRNAGVEEKLSANKNIKVEYYNDMALPVGELSKFEAWDRNLVPPPAQTVVNVCVYLALYWNYTNTYIIGADSSFFEDLHVDQETNELFSYDKHFYKNKDVTASSDGINRYVGFNHLHELVYAFGRMFEGYVELSEYAKYKGLNVYNACEYSWIDAFERKKLR